MEQKALSQADNFEVGMLHCYFCQEPDTIIMNSRLTRAAADAVREAHGKILDMTPCSKCKEWMRQGVILITIDNDKSGKNWDKEKIPNPYRTGGWLVVRDDYLKRVLSPGAALDFALQHRFMFVEHKAAEALGFFKTVARDTCTSSSTVSGPASPGPSSPTTLEQPSRLKKAPSGRKSRKGVSSVERKPKRG